MTNALVSSLIQQGDTSIQEEKDLKNDAAANAVARLFSLVNAGKLDVSVLDHLIAFAENPTAPAKGARAIGTSTDTSDELEALNTLMNSSNVKDNIKKALRKLVEGNMEVDSEGNPVVTSAADPRKLTDLEKKHDAMRAGYSELSSAFSGLGVVGDDYAKFAKDLVARHKDEVKKESDKAAKATEDKFKDSLPKKDVKESASDSLTLLGHAKQSKLPGSDDMVINHSTYDDIKKQLEWLDAHAS